MTNLTRRGFLIGLSAAGALCAAGLPSAAGSYPILYGDGEHDDSPAIRALQAGEKVICNNQDIYRIDDEGAVHLRRAHFVISEPIDLREVKGWSITDSKISTSPVFRGDAAIMLSGPKCSIVGNVLH